MLCLLSGKERKGKQRKKINKIRKRDETSLWMKLSLHNPIRKISTTLVPLFKVDHCFKGNNYDIKKTFNQLNIEKYWFNFI